MSLHYSDSDIGIERIAVPKVRLRIERRVTQNHPMEGGADSWVNP